jgi:hypothetical protein
MAKDMAIPISISTVSKIGRVGPVHWDINGNSSSGGIRGPFKVEPLNLDSRKIVTRAPQKG